MADAALEAAPAVEVPLLAGILYKQADVIKSWRKRWIVLYPTSITYYESETCGADGANFFLLLLRLVSLAQSVLRRVVKVASLMLGGTVYSFLISPTLPFIRYIPRRTTSARPLHSRSLQSLRAAKSISNRPSAWRA